MPESYAVLYSRNASDPVLRVVSPSLPGGEEAGTAVSEGTTSLLCNVTDNAFNVINGLKLFAIGYGQVQETPITLQKGTPVSADVSGGEPMFIFAASENAAMAIMASLG